MQFKREGNYIHKLPKLNTSMEPSSNLIRIIVLIARTCFSEPSSSLARTQIILIKPSLNKDPKFEASLGSNSNSVKLSQIEPIHVRVFFFARLLATPTFRLLAKEVLLTSLCVFRIHCGNVTWSLKCTPFVLEQSEHFPFMFVPNQFKSSIFGLVLLLLYSLS